MDDNKVIASVRLRPRSAVKASQKSASTSESAFADTVEGAGTTMEESDEVLTGSWAF